MRKGRANFGPCPQCWVNNVYFLNRLLAAGRTARLGSKSRRVGSTGSGSRRTPLRKTEKYAV